MKWYRANKWSSTVLTSALDDDISLMRGRGASGVRVAVHGCSDEMEGAIGAGGVDVKVFVVVAHGRR